MTHRQTVFSPCRRYRYTLWRDWRLSAELDGFGVALPRVNEYLMVIGLNPSTADETTDDPTIRKCIGFAKRWGFGALCMTNLFAWRDTLPANMKKAEFPEGIDNQHHLLRCASEAGMVLAGWGAHGSYRQADMSTRQLLSSISAPIYALKINKDGSPMHPLYVPYETQPIQLP